MGGGDLRKPARVTFQPPNSNLLFSNTVSRHDLTSRCGAGVSKRNVCRFRCSAQTFFANRAFIQILHGKRWAWKPEKEQRQRKGPQPGQYALHDLDALRVRIARRTSSKIRGHVLCPTDEMLGGKNHVMKLVEWAEKNDRDCHLRRKGGTSRQSLRFAFTLCKLSMDFGSVCDGGFWLAETVIL